VLTENAILAIGGFDYDKDTDTTFQTEEGGLKQLLVLDVSRCDLVGNWAVEMAMAQLPLLVELDARNIRGNVSLHSASRTLRFLDGRRLNCARHRRGLRSHGCCTAMTDSQRAEARKGIEPQRFYHCIDCKLLPSDELGICSVCVDTCHKGHRTFFGSMTYCSYDCAFGVAGGDGCKALLSGEEG